MDIPTMVATWNPQAEIDDYLSALAANDDRWVTAACGTEVPVIRGGRWYLYVFNPGRIVHGWLDIGTDTVATDGPDGTDR